MGNPDWPTSDQIAIWEKEIRERRQILDAADEALRKRVRENPSNVITDAFLSIPAIIIVGGIGGFVWWLGAKLFGIIH